MRKVKLTKGAFSLIDDEDYEKVIEAGKWCLNGKYAFNSKLGGLHRFIMGLSVGTGIRVQVDHINNNPLDNRKSNLRICTPSQNQQNRHLVKAGHSKFKGAHWDKRHEHWLGRIRVRGKVVYLGVFRTDVEAAKAYNEAASKYFGDFAKLNDIESTVPSTIVGRLKDKRKDTSKFRR